MDTQTDMNAGTNELLKKLLTISSVSGNELEILLFIEKYLKENGIDPVRIPVDLSRWNIFARKGSGKEGLLLQGHIDTVQSQEHYAPYEKDGRIYGIGASDMKAGIAAMIETFIKADPERPLGILITISEESGLDGIKAAMLEEKLFNDFRFVVIPEPSDLKIYPMQRGIAGIDIRITGKQRHTKNFKDSSHPLHDMIKVLSNLIEQSEERQKDSIVAVNTLQAGFKTNIIPGEVQAKVDIRVGIDDDLNAIENFLGSVMDELEWKKHPWFGPVKYTGNEIVRKLQAILGDENLYVFGGFTEMYFWDSIGKECVIFGPGLLDQAHTKDEYITISNINKYGDMLNELIKEW